MMSATLACSSATPTATVLQSSTEPLKTETSSQQTNEIGNKKQEGSMLGVTSSTETDMKFSSSQTAVSAASRPSSPQNTTGPKSYATTSGSVSSIPSLTVSGLKTSGGLDSSILKSGVNPFVATASSVSAASSSANVSVKISLSQKSSAVPSGEISTTQPQTPPVEEQALLPKKPSSPVDTVPVTSGAIPLPERPEELITAKQNSKSPSKRKRQRSPPYAPGGGNGSGTNTNSPIDITTTKGSGGSSVKSRRSKRRS